MLGEAAILQERRIACEERLLSRGGAMGETPSRGERHEQGEKGGGKVRCRLIALAAARHGSIDLREDVSQLYSPAPSVSNLPPFRRSGVLHVAPRGGLPPLGAASLGGARALRASARAYSGEGSRSDGAKVA